MAFSNNTALDPVNVDGGELGKAPSTVYTYDTFENGLVIGRFAKYDSGSLDNVDASATPVIPGVVLRNLGDTLTSGTYDSSLFPQVELCRKGLVTVEVKAGETPVHMGTVTIYNVADADAGKAMADGSGVAFAGTARFVREARTNVWWVELG